jgi:ferritin-like protein
MRYPIDPFMPAVQLAAAIRRKEVSPVEVADYYLERMDELVPRLNAFCHLLSDELPEVAEHARKAAARLVGRIGDLGGAITADPRQLLDRAPGNYEFTIPDCSNPRAITSYALERLDAILAAYQAFLDKIRGRDDVSFALVVGLLAAETHRRADVQAALAGQETPA